MYIMHNLIRLQIMMFCACASCNHHGSMQWHNKYNYILYVCIYTEQNVDGGTLKMVSEHGSYDQLKVCGLKTVADQMKL